MEIKYGIIGFTGRMGKEISNIMQEKGHKLVFGFDEKGKMFNQNPQLLIDFSNACIFNSTVDFAKEFKCPLIVGTTSLSEQDISLLKDLSETIPIVFSYNYSIGIQMMLKCIETIKCYLEDWDIEISETHHRFKVDKPSGTAKMIRDTIGKKVNISSLRLGNIAGDHTITFGGLGETLSITHSATSRRTFAEGVLKSAEFIVNKKSGLYSFTDVIQDVK